MGFEKMAKLKVGVIGLGRVGTTLIEDISSSKGEYISYPLSRSRDKTISVRKDLCRRDRIVTTNSLEDILIETDVTVIAIRNTNKPSAFIERKGYLKYNLPEIVNLGKQFQKYKGIVLMVTNPVDECSFAFWEASGLDSGQIIGLNYTDTIRCGRVIQDLYEKEGEKLEFEDIFGYYSVGPHNQFVFPLISKLEINGKDTNFIKQKYAELRTEISDYAKKQIDGGISTTRTTVDAILKVLESISEGNKTITASSYFGGIFIGLPLKIEKGRAKIVIEPDIDFSSEEIDLFKEGYSSLLDSLAEVSFTEKALSKARQTLVSFERNIEIVKPLPPKVESGKDTIDTKAFLIYRLNPYLFHKKLGVGAHGDVYKAEDVTTGQIVAVKKSKDINTLGNEAEILKSMHYQNIIKFIDYFVNGDEGFLIMEYANSGFEKISSEILDVRLQRVYELFSGLSYIHRHGLIHTDIKPENILLGNGRFYLPLELKIIDFSLSLNKCAGKIINFKGPLGYTSPEALEGHITPSADIYSAGAVAFEILTELPYYHVKGASLRDINPQLPKSISKIIARCLEDDIILRYSSSDDVVKDLKHNGGYRWTNRL